VSALAAALGVKGTAAVKDGAWAAGPQDGTAPYLSVGLDGTLSFFYSNPQIAPWACVPEAETTLPCAPKAAGALPSPDAAIDALRSLIDASGRDAEAFQYAAEAVEGSVTQSAQAWPTVDGQRVDQPWTLELASDGIVSASGSLASLVGLGDYAVVSEKEAFERLSDPRFGARMTNLPIALRVQATDAQATDAQATATAESPAWVPPTEPPATPSAGQALSWPVHHVDIVSARLGLASQWQPDGSVLVVPAYEFTDAEGGTWSVIAVADSKLDFATE
jgi:hypothetical protein